MRGELLGLASLLRHRVEFSREGDWTAPVEVAALPVEALDKGARLAALAGEIKACRKCPLGATRLNAVPGVGSPEARVLFVGEGPGFEEDHKGEPFVGKSGQLLDRILASIGLSRQSVYIANVVKCHPMQDPANPEARGNDRPPSPEETQACRAYLDEQIRVIAPKVLVTLGAVAMRALLGEPSLRRVRGQWRSYTPAFAGARAIRLLPTYHPAALLRDPSLKQDVWTDMKNLKLEVQKTGSCGNPGL